MKFDTPEEFLLTFGENTRPSKLCSWLGVNHKVPERLLKKLGIPICEQPPEPAWWDHLPGLPSFTTVKQWRGGTIYRIDCIQAGDSPGFLSVLLHTAGHLNEDLQLDESED